MIVRRGRPPEAAYTFKHALVQDAAYSSLLHKERKELHAKIAAVLSEMHPEKAEREPELLAHHLTEANQTERAVAFWLKAGQRAAKTQANLEAIGHLRRGLEVVERNLELPDRDRIEVALRIELGICLISAKGYAVGEVEENYERALNLGQQLGDEEKIFAATRGLWVCHFIRADLAKAQDLSSQLLELAMRTHPSDAVDGALHGTGRLIEAHRALGMTQLYAGCFFASRDHLKSALSLYNPNLHGYLMEFHGIEPGVVCLSYLGFLLWFLGCSDQAREYSEQALSNAERLRHPYTIAFALTFRAYLCQLLRDVEGTRYNAHRAIAISSEHKFLHWKHQATLLRGWALAELGQIDDGLSQIRAGLDGYAVMESWLACSWFRSLLANAYLKAARPDAALRALDDAFAVAERTGEQFFLAELNRLQGEITLRNRGLEAAAEAEACYNRSFEICRKQQALSWELRTAVSLARLWRDLGKYQEAAGLLAPICSKINEGLDTSDFKEAIQIKCELEARGGNHAL